MTYSDYLIHYGIKNQKWGKKNGPPYPLSDDQRSAAEKKANPLSRSAKALAKLGPDNRFKNSAKGSSASGAAKDTNLVRSEKDSSASGTTYEDIHMDRTKKFAGKYEKKSSISKPSPEESGGKAKKTAEQKAAEKAAKEAKRAAEKAAKEAEKAAEKERKRVEKAEERAMKVIDRLFNGSTSDRDMDALLNEFNDGWLNGKNFDAEDFKELGKAGRESKGSDFYSKALAQLGDSDDPKIKALRKKYEKIIKEQDEEDAEQGYEELETLKKRMGADYKDKSLDRFSRSISAMTDYVDMMRDANPTEMNRARSRVLSYLEDKLSWFSENGSNSSERTPTLKEKRNMQKVTAWLRKQGF